MILLTYNLRLAAAYFFEKRNRSPVPVMMVSLIFLLPRSRSQSTEVFPAVDDHVSLLTLPLPTHSGQDLQALRNFALFGNASSRK